jgi:DNA modification methylase
MSLTRVSRSNGVINQVDPVDRPVHEWYRFVLSYPPHLVRDYLERFGIGGRQRVLDPFCGTGTTVVECKKRGIRSAGIEAHPMSHLAASVKADWDIDPDALVADAEAIAERTLRRLDEERIPDRLLPLFERAGAAKASDPAACCVALRTLSPDRAKLLLKDSISPRPLHKALVLIDELNDWKDEPSYDHLRVALARALVDDASNLHFGPEVGVGKIKRDAAVIEPWLAGVRRMADDLRDVAARRRVEAEVFHADARSAEAVLRPRSIDAVITSPPYPNEKDYTRTTRLESVLLGLINSKEELQACKKGLVRSNTRGVYKEDDDQRWIEGHPEIERIATDIENRRLELGKTSGFERMYHRVTRLYFGGMARHFANLRQVLKPGAQLAYVVGDQASYLRVMIRTGQLLAEIAESLGYEVTSLDLFRTRLATATNESLREEVVVLRWPGTVADLA